MFILIICLWLLFELALALVFSIIMIMIIIISSSSSGSITGTTACLNSYQTTGAGTWKRYEEQVQKYV